jgi:hypothetical protein
MNLKLPKGFAQKASRALKKSAPTILTCIGAVGVVTTAVFTAKATPKAIERVNRAKSVKMAEKGENLTRMETIGACWTCYAPAAIAGIATIGSIFGANALNKRQQASLMAAYAFLDRSFREYKNSVKEVFGEEGHDRVMKNLMIEHPKPPTIYGSTFGESFDFGETTDEPHLFYDSFSQRYFDATFSDVLLAELHTNRNFAINGEVSLKDFYVFLGLDTPDELKDLCWFVSDFYYFVDFTHTRSLIDDGPNEEPVECWVIEMPFPPTLEPIED